MNGLKRSLGLLRYDQFPRLFVSTTEFASVAHISRLDHDHLDNGISAGHPTNMLVSRAKRHHMTERVLPKRRNMRKKHSLVIFDKDGTLICFSSMWVPWARETAARLVQLSGLDIARPVFKLLGFCPVEDRVRNGLLAHGTIGQIREGIGALLMAQGVEREKADQIVQQSVRECNTSSAKTLRQIYDLQWLFRSLKSYGMKIAICTSDNRAGTLSAMHNLGLEPWVDFVMCGDDANSKPKPNPHNALHICHTLGVRPEEALMVGDTIVDMSMGRAARLGATVGVLSGICHSNELQPYADHIVDHVGDLLSVLANDENMPPSTDPSDAVPEFTLVAMG